MQRVGWARSRRLRPLTHLPAHALCALYGAIIKGAQSLEGNFSIRERAARTTGCRHTTTTTTAAVAAECGCNRSHIIIFISAPAATRRAQKQPPNRAARGNISPRVWRRHKAETRARVKTHSLMWCIKCASLAYICMVTHTAHVKLAVQILFFAIFWYLLLGVGRRAFQGQRGQRRGHGLLGTLLGRVLHLLLHVRLIVEHTP